MSAAFSACEPAFLILNGEVEISQDEAEQYKHSLTFK